MNIDNSLFQTSLILFVLLTIMPVAINVFMTYIPVLPVTYIVYIYKSIKKYGKKNTMDLIISFVFSLLSFLAFMFCPAFGDKHTPEGYEVAINRIVFSCILIIPCIIFVARYLSKKKQIDQLNKNQVKS